MKTTTLTLILTVFCLTGWGQKPTEFRDIDFNRALETAAQENKLVFLDAYTSWCGPCKMMASQIFPQPVLGDFMNEHFVNVKYDMEQGEGREINARYGIDAYPTFLILNPDGTLRNKIVGASGSAEEFKEIVEKALSVQVDILGLQSRYEGGDRSVDFLTEYIQGLSASGDAPKARQVSEELLGSLTDQERTAPALWFIFNDPEIAPMGSASRSYLMTHIDAFYSSVGKEEVNRVIAPIYEERLEDILRGRDRQTTLPQITLLGEEIQALDLENKDLLLGYVRLLESSRRAEAAAYLEACKELLENMPDQKLAYLYFNFGIELKKIANPEQIAQFAQLSREVAERVEDSRVKTSMYNYIDSQLN